jgi:hypothetical protein
MIVSLCQKEIAQFAAKADIAKLTRLSLLSRYLFVAFVYVLNLLGRPNAVGKGTLFL